MSVNISISGADGSEIVIPVSFSGSASISAESESSVAVGSSFASDISVDSSLEASVGAEPSIGMVIEFGSPMTAELSASASFGIESELAASIGTSLGVSAEINSEVSAGVSASTSVGMEVEFVSPMTVQSSMSISIAAESSLASEMSVGSSVGAEFASYAEIDVVLVSSVDMTIIDTPISEIEIEVAASASSTYDPIHEDLSYDASESLDSGWSSQESAVVGVSASMDSDAVFESDALFSADLLAGVSGQSHETAYASADLSFSVNLEIPLFIPLSVNPSSSFALIEEQCAIALQADLSNNYIIESAASFNAFSSFVFDIVPADLVEMDNVVDVDIQVIVGP